jgi:alkyldihydroxyacetonephosphate synthase
MHAVKFGRLKRIPDYIVYPEDDREVVQLVELAIRHNVCLIPYGGGTNVTDALRCPENEARPIVSVDMSRMNRILWVDPYNRMACIQAGAVGRTIFEQLEKYGFTIGHEPDSVEFSTMGGWVATHASGMKKNRYGNIEDLVVDLTAVTPAGKLERRQALPRESIGVDPKRWFFGSEGSLGIITSVVVKIFPVPEVRKYGSVLFHTFDRGFAFLYDLQRQGNVPASVRLVDNMQFQFGQALKSGAKGLTRIKKPLEKWLVTGPLGYDPEEMVALTLVFEGTADEVEAQEKAVYKLAKRYKGFPGGAENGKRGYQLTFGIAYIRDFVMRHHILAESFETSVAWSDAQALCANVKKRVNEVYAQKGLPGRPFISCRVTQLYQTGVCIYFYFAFYAKGVENAVQVYQEIEHEARTEILRCGGSLSHHHGVGKLRQGFLPDVLSPAAIEWRSNAKQALDPHNVFGAGNIPVADATDLLVRAK